MGPALPYLSVSAAATIAGALHRRRAAEITKPLPLLVLAAHSLRGTRRRNGVDNALLAGALAFSAAGDRAMLLEEFTDEPSDKDRRLQIGASLFAGAQLCLTGIMWRRGARPRPAGVLLRTAILAESATVMALRRPRLLPVLGGYGNTLALMSSTAGASHRPQPRLRNGGWLFLASDLTIINRRHLIRDERLAAMAEAWVLASYFAAQWLLVTSLSEPDG
ncbi:lysoplasmalogenase family protein [Gordonia sp. DT101]|uniref:lysoplasmalogenase family protein n=1 Tax=Gordonia sp. DT101 TaxID=3416545 RepID=UPI003CF3E97D